MNNPRMNERNRVWKQRVTAVGVAGFVALSAVIGKQAAQSQTASAAAVTTATQPSATTISVADLEPTLAAPRPMLHRRPQPRHPQSHPCPPCAVAPAVATATTAAHRHRIADGRRVIHDEDHGILIVYQGEYAHVRIEITSREGSP